MAFKEMNDLNADVTISLGGTNRKTNKKNPTQVEGYYLGSREVPDKKKKSGISYIHVFQTPEGSLGVWGKTDLDRKILAVTPGSMVRATSTGTRPTSNGDMYTYKVEVDTDNTIDVSLVAGATASANTGVSNDGGTDDDGGNEEEDDNEDGGYEAPARQANNVPNEQRQARVAALLGKNKNK